MRQKTVVLTFMLAAWVPAAIAQEPQGYVRNYCVKVMQGKIPEFEALIHDPLAKLLQVRMDQGELAWWNVMSAVIPAGTSARCDYIVTYGYDGFPPESKGREQAEADFRKTKVKMTYAELLAKRDAISTLVSDDLWRTAALAGPGSQKGSYVRLNLNKIKPGHPLADWVKLEGEGWKPFAEAMARETPGFGWRAAQLIMPNGSGLHYNVMTVDIFPNWSTAGEAVTHGFSGQLWEKVHADLAVNDFMSKAAEASDRYRVELYTVIERGRKQ